MRTEKTPPGLWLIALLVATPLVLILIGEEERSPSVVELQVSERAPLPLEETEAPASYAGAVARASPAVVNIYTSKTIERKRHPLFDDPLFGELFGGLTRPRQQRQTSLGSGVIVSPQGYLLTNHHVIEDADQIEILLADGRSVNAKLIGSDPESDLAVLRVSLENAPSIVLGNADQLRVGDVVLAIGNPFGVGQTVTQGIVSATRRNRLGVSTFENFIQTDAAINPGNSGGALINAYGELVGINTAIFSRSGGSQGIGFAIPVELARTVLEQIIQHGRPQRGWLGVEIQEISPALAESFQFNNTRGVLIAGVVPKGPADHAGLMAGDIITGVDDEIVADPTELLNRIASQPPGTSLRLKGWRGGRPFERNVDIGERPQISLQAR